jgi:hypothetical protein
VGGVSQRAALLNMKAPYQGAFNDVADFGRE